jgi:hypothetical protein
MLVLINEIAPQAISQKQSRIVPYFRLFLKIDTILCLASGDRNSDNGLPWKPSGFSHGLIGDHHVSFQRAGASDPDEVDSPET